MNLALTLPRPHVQLWLPIKKSYNVKLTVINGSTRHKVFSVYNTQNFNTTLSSAAVIQRIYRNISRFTPRLCTVHPCWEIYKFLSHYFSIMADPVCKALRLPCSLEKVPSFVFILYYWSFCESSCHHSEWLMSYFGAETLDFCPPYRFIG